jgi:hypothetical protein
MDGELSQQEVASVTDHLERCEPCRDEYESLSYSHELVERLDLIDLPFGESWRRIESEIAPSPAFRMKPEPRSSGLWFLFPRWVPLTALAAAAVLAVSFLVVVPYQQRNAEVERAFRAYIQVREGQFSEPSNIPDPDAGIRVRPAVYNPFADSNQISNRNPFKLE